MPILEAFVSRTKEWLKFESNRMGAFLMSVFSASNANWVVESHSNAFFRRLIKGAALAA